MTLDLNDTLNRESIVRELIQRSADIKESNGWPLTVASVRRNPNTPVSIVPAVQWFEEDSANKDERTNAKKQPREQMKTLVMVAELWLEGDTGKTGPLVIAFYKQFLKKIYEGDGHLGKAFCRRITETRTSGVLGSGSESGEDRTGMIIEFEILYTETFDYTINT